MYLSTDIAHSLHKWHLCFVSHNLTSLSVLHSSKKMCFLKLLHKGDICSWDHGLLFWIYWRSVVWCLLSACCTRAWQVRKMSVSQFPHRYSSSFLFGNSFSYTDSDGALCSVQEARCACLKEFSSNINVLQGTYGLRVGSVLVWLYAA